jgi:hypothetical protein
MIEPDHGSPYQKVELSERLVVRGVSMADREVITEGRVLACIRKDAVRVTRAARLDGATGVIAAASWLGAEEEYIVDVAGMRIQAIGPAIGLAKGDPVNVSMTPDAWVFVR